MYYLKNGESVTADQIKTAYKAGLCILVHQHSPRGTITALATDGVHMDTRHDDDLISLSDAVWTTAPASLREALNAAYIHMCQTLINPRQRAGEWERKMKKLNKKTEMSGYKITGSSGLKTKFGGTGGSSTADAYKKCVMCGSHAINPGLHGRIEGLQTDLCDVCYWRIRADNLYEPLYNVYSNILRP